LIQIFLNELELPINIPNFEKTINGNNEVIGTAGLGDIVIGKKQGLATFDFESFFPHTTEKTAKSYVEEIEEMRATNQPINLVITEIDEDILVLIDDFDYNRNHGNYLDIDYNISFTEYKPFGAYAPYEEEAETDETRPTPPPREEVNKPPVLRTHTVVRGDNLYNITRTKTGNPQNWRELYELNKVTIGNNPNLIFPGQILNIPEGWV